MDEEKKYNLEEDHAKEYADKETEFETETESKKIEFFIAGVQHHDSYKVLHNIKVDDFLQMVLEPTNKYDPNAVRLYFNDTMIGFVPARLSAEVSALVTSPDTLYSCKIIEFNKDSKPWDQFKVCIEEA